MKALICPSLGPAENLKVMDVEPPLPAEGEVVVEVAYAALNFFDTLIIEGKVPAQARAALFARGRVLRPRRRARAGREGLCGRRPGDGLVRLRRRARTDRRIRRTASPMFPTAFRSTRRPASRSPTARRCTR